MASTVQEGIAALLSPMDSRVSVWHTSSQAPLVQTYTFETAQPSDLDAQFSGWTPFSAEDKTLIRGALAELTKYINVTFTEVSRSENPDPDINLGQVNLGNNGGLGGYSYQFSTNSQNEVTRKSLDSFAVFDRDAALDRNLVLHELGHAMTLKHPGAYDDGGNVPPGPYLPASEDNNKFSVMSYNENPTNGEYSDNLMLFDIAALQARFGANLGWRTGSDVYGGPDGNVQVIWDAGGIDAISGLAVAGGTKIDLREGQFSSIGAQDNLAIAYGATIENARGGAGADTITGNSGVNRLDGLGGNDRLNGAGGADVLLGGAGNDVLTGLSAVDRLTGGTGNDTLTGGLGTRDDFIYLTGADSRGAAGDLIVDFEHLTDKINIADVSAGAFRFAGQQTSFSGAANEVRYERDAGADTTHVYGDLDGNRAADFHIRLDGLLTLTRPDFIF